MLDVRGVVVAVLVCCAGVVLLYGSLLHILAMATLPLWLPRVVLKLRFFLFTRINGDEGMEIPNSTITAEHFMWLYSHPAANIRSQQRDVGLTDLFWYLLHPASYIHQEHVESGTQTYNELAAATRKVHYTTPCHFFFPAYLLLHHDVLREWFNSFH